MKTQPMTIKCPKCGNRTSMLGDFCEHCGCHIRKTERKKPIYKKWWFWAIIVLVAICVLPFGSSDDSDTEANDKAATTYEPSNQPNNSTTNKNTDTNTEGKVESKPESETKEEKPEEVEKTIEFTIELSNGYYTSGIDFPAGKYNITAIKGNGNVSSDNMFSGGINAMMGVDNPEIYELEYKNIDLSEGVVLEISSGLTVSIHSDKASAKPLSSREQPNTETISLSNGYFVAGEDFPEGVYDVLATSGHGNVSSDNMFDGGLNEVMGAEETDFYIKLFKNATFSEGTTLKVDGVDIDLIPSK